MDIYATQAFNAANKAWTTCDTVDIPGCPGWTSPPHPPQASSPPAGPTGAKSPAPSDDANPDVDPLLPGRRVKSSSFDDLPDHQDGSPHSFSARPRTQQSGLASREDSGHHWDPDPESEDSPATARKEGPTTQSRVVGLSSTASPPTDGP